MHKTEREIIFHEQHFVDFYYDLSENVQSKIEYVLKLIKQIERIPDKFLKHVEGTHGLYEIRVESNSNIFRIFCCFDEGNRVVLFNGFTKKSMRIPKSEIAKALILKSEYFNKKPTS